jgi:excisionase family DNA binding protein
MSDHRETGKLLLRVQEVAAMLGIGRSSVWAKVKNGKLPEPIKIGGSTRWRLADLQPLVQATPTTRPSSPDAEEGTQPGCMQP